MRLIINGKQSVWEMLIISHVDYSDDVRLGQQIGTSRSESTPYVQNYKDIILYINWTNNPVININQRIIHNHHGPT